MPSETILLAGVPVRGLPSKVMEPLRALSRPATVLSVVDLPAPLAPMSVTISRSLTSKETPLMAWMLP